MDSQAKMVKQEDYTVSRKAMFENFHMVLARQGLRYFFEWDHTIDGLEVELAIQQLKDKFRFTIEVCAGNNNGIMFHDECRKYKDRMVLFCKYFRGGYKAVFNDMMAFYHNEVPHMKLRGDHILTAKAYEDATTPEALAEEQEFREENPDHCCPFSDCQVRVEKYHIYDLSQKSEKSHEDWKKECKESGSGYIPRLITPMCIKCYITHFPLFDPAKHKPSQKVDLRDNKYLLDDSHGRVVCDVLKDSEDRSGVALIKISHKSCDCHDGEGEDEEEDEEMNHYYRLAFNNEECEDWDEGDEDD
jgi:hypothetical protein